MKLLAPDNLNGNLHVPRTPKRVGFTLPAGVRRGSGAGPCRLKRGPVLSLLVA
jgi:hypothetical protein